MDEVFDRLAGYSARFDVDHFTRYEHNGDGSWQPIRAYPLADAAAAQPGRRGCQEPVRRAEMRAKPARISSGVGASATHARRGRVVVVVLVEVELRVVVEHVVDLVSRASCAAVLRVGDLRADLVQGGRRQQRFDHRHQVLVGDDVLRERERVRALVRPADHRLPVLVVVERAEGDDPGKVELRRVRPEVPKSRSDPSDHHLRF